MFLSVKKLVLLFDCRTRIQFSLLFGLMLVSALLETVGIGMIMPFIAVMSSPEVIESNDWLRQIKTFTGASTPFDFLLYMGMAFVSFYILKNICLGFLTYLQLRFVFSKRSLFGKRLLKSYMLKPYTFHLQRNSAELIRNILIETIRAFNYVQSLLKACSELFVFTAVMIMLLLVNPAVVIFSVLMLGSLSVLFYKSVSNYLRKLGQKVQDSLGQMSQAVIEGLGAIKEIKTSGHESYFPDRYYLSMMDNARANWQYSTINTLPKLFLEVVAVGSVILFIMLLRGQGQEFKTMLPVLSLFAMAIVRLMPSLSQIISNMHSIRFDSAAIDIIYDDMIGGMQFMNKLNKRNSTLHKLSFSDELIIQKLAYCYPNSEIPALNDVSLKIKKNQTIAFAGPSGAGKTTLANLILGLLTPTAGKIFVDKVDISSQLSSWQMCIGYVPQSIYLLDASIRQNIAFCINQKEIDEILISKALKIAQLESFVRQLPAGLETKVGENGVRLSGGQRQRLGIARAIYHDPDILILDEATSALDGETEQEVSSAIQALSGRKTIIIIAHRLSTIQKCDCIYYFKDGKIADFGPFGKLVRTSPDFKRMAESGKIAV